MDKVFNFELHETRWRKKIGENANPGSGNYFGIIMPPPNITGDLHIGHGFQIAIMDTLIRFQRMQGDTCYLQAGIDHAGIGAQIVVENMLYKKLGHRPSASVLKQELLSWKTTTSKKIIHQMIHLGASCDREHIPFTMDLRIARMVEDAFIALYQRNIIYRDYKILHCDPSLGSVVSDLEVDMRSEMTAHYRIIYRFSHDSNAYISVDTTRPETLFGDQAIAVHPDDSRYKAYINKFVVVPLIHKKIKVIADLRVDREFGTGAVKITPSHDFLDWDIAQDHALDPLEIFDAHGQSSSNLSSAYSKKDSMSLRKIVVYDLKHAGVLHSVRKAESTIPYSTKTGTKIEPRLMKQWFIRVSDIIPQAIQALETDTIRFFPPTWKNHALAWLHNMKDWCISRTLVWGHPIPVFYDQEDHAYCARSKEEVYTKYNLSKDTILHQETDILDTWFSSALWPYSAPNPDIQKKFYPWSVLVSGFDILFFWVIRMIMMNLALYKNIPFHDVYLTGLIRDKKNRKMSKSQGNVIDPMDITRGISLKDLLFKRTNMPMHAKISHNAIINETQGEFPDGIEAVGNDALRLAFLSFAGLQREIPFSLDKVHEKKIFLHKIWNIGRYIHPHITPLLPKIEIKHLYNLDIIEGIQILQRDIHHYLRVFRFDQASEILHAFIWHRFCDRYIEASKILLDIQEYIHETSYTLTFMLSTILKTLYPFAPYISETLYDACFCDDITSKIDIPNISMPQHQRKTIPCLETMINDIRKLRTHNMLKANLECAIYIETHNALVLMLLEGSYRKIIEHACRCTIHLGRPCDLEKNEYIRAHYPEKIIYIYISLSHTHNLIQVFIHSKNKILKKLEACNVVLKNKNFENNAPKDVILMRQKQRNALKLELENLEERISTLEKTSKISS